MKKIFGLAAIFLMISANCFAMSNMESDSILSEMYSNPQNFIYIGSGGTGYHLYIDKNSVEVCEYNPPHYLIKFRTIGLSYAPKREGLTYGSKGERVSSYRYTFYYYNYQTQSMYRRFYKENGEFKEEDYIDASTYSKWTNSSRPLLNGGEIAFYLAYNMSFYKKPVSYLLQDYMKTKKWNIFD